MSWQAPKLRYRVQIRKGVQSDNVFGGFDRSYETLITVWAGLKRLSDYSTYIRGVQTDDKETHEFIVRFFAVEDLGKEFTSAFGDSFNKQADSNPLKSDYFIFLQEGSTVKGRLFRIRRIQRDEKRREFLIIKAEEIEEQGTGYPI